MCIDINLYKSAAESTACNSWNANNQRYDNTIPTFFGLTLSIHIWLIIMCFSCFIDKIGHARGIIENEDVKPNCTYIMGSLGTLILFCLGIVMLCVSITLENFGNCAKNISGAYFMLWNIPCILIIVVLV